MQFELRVLAIVFAVALQIQATLPLGDGLRAAASDLFLPIALIYVLPWFAFQPSRLQWRMPGVAWWLASITAALTVALFVGHRAVDHWSTWALVNKFGGWFALAAYFVIGTAIGRSGRPDLRIEFFRVFLLTAAVIASANVIAMPWLMNFYTLPFLIEFNRATGLLANSNAYGFFLVVAVLLVFSIDERPKWYLPPLLAALWFSSSRGAFLALIFGLAALLVLRPDVWKQAIRSAALAVSIVAAVTGMAVVVEPARLSQAQSGHSPLGFFAPARLDAEAESITDRQEQFLAAWDMFSSAPLFGHGLGSFVETRGTTLHNSLLWLLAETGVVGTVVLIGFLISAVRCLYSNRSDPLMLGVLAVAAAFAGMSLTSEVLYQRHLWLLLGIALASPVTEMKPAARSFNGSFSENSGTPMQAKSRVDD